MVVIALIVFQSTFVEVCNSEMDNNDNSFRETISKQWTFYKRL